ncbi:hypothetical protein GE061_009426 [Apolygus lucorum]|uniref:Carboxypeptidase Q n=1 Tax=Apolygus lucorum TaxID=248454 RepID=A0A8S9Y0H4_APOLU|nr:hypothetical protein GE061_009426 [Apolygus lucorum]
MMLTSTLMRLCFIFSLNASFEKVLAYDGMHIFNADRSSSTSQCPSAHLTKEIRSYEPIARKIMDAVIKGRFSGEVWNELATFVDKFGPRMSGTRNLERAIDYMVDRSRSFGLDNVRTENVTVPHWFRGEESATLLRPRVKELSILGLGGSVATGPNGLEAEVIVVKSFRELKKRAAEVSGKLVVFAHEYHRYFQSFKYRNKGAAKAAQFGAVGALICSLTPPEYSMMQPHTGWQVYTEGIRKIPVAAITVEDSHMLKRMQQRGDKIVIRLKMEARNLPDKTSRNTMAEVTGHSEPELYVVVSGHIDSWDVGDGSVDNGGGAFISWYTPVLLKKLGLTPRRTVRATLWTAEEVGKQGSHKYKKSHPDDEIVFLFESDKGTFNPKTIGFQGTREAMCIFKEIYKLLTPIGPIRLKLAKNPGTDIQVWEKSGIPMAELVARGDKYFRFHHSRADNIDVQEPDMMDRCLAVMAIVSYVVADLSVRLPRGPHHKSEVMGENITARKHVNYDRKDAKHDLTRKIPSKRSMKKNTSWITPSPWWIKPRESMNSFDEIDSSPLEPDISGEPTMGTPDLFVDDREESISPSNEFDNPGSPPPPGGTWSRSWSSFKHFEKSV